MYVYVHILYLTHMLAYACLVLCCDRQSRIFRRRLNVVWLSMFPRPRMYDGVISVCDSLCKGACGLFALSYLISQLKYSEMPLRFFSPGLVLAVGFL